MIKILGFIVICLVFWALKSEYETRMIATVAIIAILGFMVMSKKR